MIRVNGDVQYKLDANSVTTLDFIVEEETPVGAAEVVKTLMRELQKGLPAEEDPS